jgi:LuxR family maltose regulon positive regulatory protein
LETRVSPVTALSLLGEALGAVAADGLVLVLDDYHELQSPAAHELMRSLIDLIGPTVPVLVTSRTKPPFRLARRLAAREANIIGAAQLAFSAAETKALLNEVHSVGLDEQELTRVEAGLHGWPVGLSLLILSMLGSEHGQRAGVDALLALSAHRMVDYVIEEDIAHVSAEQRRLRLYSSVVDRVNGPLAVALLDDPAAALLLEELREQGQLIVTSDGHAGGWLSIQELVRRPLQLALERDEPGMAAIIQDRASAWFERNGMISDAIHSAVAAGNAERVDALLNRHAMALAMARRTGVLREALALERAPGSPSGPYLEALDLLVSLLDGAHQGGLVVQARVLHERYADRPEVLLVTSLLVASPFAGDISGGIRVGYEALRSFEHLPGFTTRIAPGLAGCLMFDGRYEDARLLVEPLITSPSESSQIYAHSFLARVNVVDGDPATAEWHGRRAVELLEASFSDVTGDFVWVRAALADALRVNGSLTEARRQLDLSLEAERHRPGSVIQGILLVSDAELCLAEGKRGRARTSIRRARQIYGSYPDVGTAVWARLQAVEADITAPVATATTGSMPTPAELRVLEMLVQTPSRAVIASALYLSESTVKSHLRRIYRRLGVKNREEALAAARARGLLGDRRHAGEESGAVEGDTPTRRATP